jgi:Histidine phosphatase superfamily (branch 1)
MGCCLLIHSSHSDRNPAPVRLSLSSRLPPRYHDAPALLPVSVSAVSKPYGKHIAPRVSALQVAEYFRSQELDAIYSSDLLRALQTAELIAKAKGLEVNTTVCAPLSMEEHMERAELPAARHPATHVPRTPDHTSPLGWSVVGQHSQQLCRGNPEQKAGRRDRPSDVAMLHCA